MVTIHSTGRYSTAEAPSGGGGYGASNRMVHHSPSPMVVAEPIFLTYAIPIPQWIIDEQWGELANKLPQNHELIDHAADMATSALIKAMSKMPGVVNFGFDPHVEFWKKVESVYREDHFYISVRDSADMPAVAKLIAEFAPGLYCYNYNYGGSCLVTRIECDEQGRVTLIESGGIAIQWTEWDEDVTN